jgi:hypothetical protein
MAAPPGGTRPLHLASQMQRALCGPELRPPGELSPAVRQLPNLLDVAVCPGLLRVIIRGRSAWAPSALGLSSPFVVLLCIDSPLVCSMPQAPVRSVEQGADDRPVGLDLSRRTPARPTRDLSEHRLVKMTPYNPTSNTARPCPRRQIAGRRTGSTQPRVPQPRRHMRSSRRCGGFPPLMGAVNRPLGGSTSSSGESRGGGA